MASHPLLDAASQDDKTHARRLRFATTLAAHPLWVCGHPGQTVDGGVPTRVAFTPYDGGARLGLTSYVDQQAPARDPAFPGGPLIACTGALLLSWTRQQKFDAVLSDGERIVIVPYGELCNLRTALLLSSTTLNDSDKEPALPSIAPFARAVYAYCAGRADVRRCWLGFIVAPGGVISVAVMLDASSQAFHEEQFEQLSQLHLPPGLALLHLDPTALRDEPGARDLRERRPFYCKTHPQTWWTKLRWRVSMPPLPVVRLEARATGRAPGPAPA
ncbi:hypothetical protein [Caldimonas brevitalea]|uniref:Uncharacterized protein n=1 Tax=Caldimonas brevitalea TaxID=413882 RepID=A0A0G3BK26_9BURK|nr:hypothetical protein [Caldimonas brevitalea]AKJ26885.1 hypothetical protein AAW51_0194 [Caldimonas brevitalea]